MNRVITKVKKQGFLNTIVVDVIEYISMDSIFGDTNQSYTKLKSGMFVNRKTGEFLSQDESWELSDKLEFYG